MTVAPKPVDDPGPDDDEQGSSSTTDDEQGSEEDEQGPEDDEQGPDDDEQGPENNQQRPQDDKQEPDVKAPEHDAQSQPQPTPPESQAPTGQDAEPTPQAPTSQVDSTPAAAAQPPQAQAVNLAQTLDEYRKKLEMMRRVKLPPEALPLLNQLEGRVADLERLVAKQNADKAKPAETQKAEERTEEAKRPDGPQDQPQEAAKEAQETPTEQTPSAAQPEPASGTSPKASWQASPKLSPKAAPQLSPKVSPKVSPSPAGEPAPYFPEPPKMDLAASGEAPGADVLALVFAGFVTPGFNDVYIANDQLLVGGMPTYWTEDGVLFMYMDCVKQRWQLSPRWEDPADGSPLVDMLADAQQGNSRAMAFQVGSTLWNEFNAGTGEWCQSVVQASPLAGYSLTALAERLKAREQEAKEDESKDVSMDAVDSAQEVGIGSSALATKVWHKGIAFYKTPGSETFELVPPEVKQRLLAPGQVPPFNSEARGTPFHWNEASMPLYWGPKIRSHFPNAGDRKPDISKISEFLRQRRGPDGKPVSYLLGKPEWKTEGWYRFPFKPFDEKSLPKTSPGEWGEADWQPAWHGSKFEALYSILYHRKLAASCDAEKGERFHDQAPGVYVHKESTGHKVSFYMRFVPLCRDGIFWGAKWEVRVDRADRVPVKNTDQWVQKERSVRLVALWVCGRRSEDMEDSWEVSRCWDPLMEANPNKKKLSSAEEGKAAQQGAEDAPQGGAKRPAEGDAAPDAKMPKPPPPPRTPTEDAAHQANLVLQAQQQLEQVYPQARQQQQLEMMQMAALQQQQMMAAMMAPFQMQQMQQASMKAQQEQQAQARQVPKGKGKGKLAAKAQRVVPPPPPPSRQQPNKEPEVPEKEKEKEEDVIESRLRQIEAKEEELKRELRQIRLEEDKIKRDQKEIELPPPRKEEAPAPRRRSEERRPPARGGGRSSPPQTQRRRPGPGSRSRGRTCSPAARKQHGDDRRPRSRSCRSRRRQSRGRKSRSRRRQKRGDSRSRSRGASNSRGQGTARGRGEGNQQQVDKSQRSPAKESQGSCGQGVWSPGGWGTGGGSSGQNGSAPSRAAVPPPGPCRSESGNQEPRVPAAPPPDQSKGSEAPSSSSRPGRTRRSGWDQEEEPARETPGGAPKWNDLFGQAQQLRPQVGAQAAPKLPPPQAQQLRPQVGAQAAPKPPPPQVGASLLQQLRVTPAPPQPPKPQGAAIQLDELDAQFSSVRDLFISAMTSSKPH